MKTKSLEFKEKSVMTTGVHSINSKASVKNIQEL